MRLAGNPTDPAADAKAWANVLAGIPLFASLGQRHLRKVAGTGRIERFHDATAIVRSG